MAAYSHHHSRAGSRTSASVFNALGEQQELPNGSCNFRDLSLGARAPPCGCQRFWLNVGHFGALDGPGGSERAWCFCGHHACFHNALSQQTQPQRVQESIQASNGMSGVGHLRTDNDEAPEGYVSVQQNRPTSPKRLTGLGIQPESRSLSQATYTRMWDALNSYARQQADSDVSETTSKLPSTAAPSLVEETTISPERRVQAEQRPCRPMGPPVNIPQGSIPRTNPEEYSATEVATPSIAGTPDFRALASSSNQTRNSPGHLQPGNLQPRPAPAPIPDEPSARAPAIEQEQPTPSASATLSAQEVQTILRSYGQRLDILESVSFSHIPVEELQERFDLVDGRLLDLEQWRNEHEKLHTSPEPDGATSSKRRRLLPTGTNSFSSDISFDSNAAAQTEAMVLATLASNSVTNPRIEALEDRIADLEDSALPSYTRPWQVQVVLLPWGRELRGIWFSSTQATQHSIRSTTQIPEEWTGASSAPKLSFQSSTSAAWTTESIQAWANEAHDWLSPKACGPTGRVFNRLASRGLVRDVTLTASDARHILDKIADAFGIAVEMDSGSESEETNRYQALRERFIPLRKVRKSARLRFLNPAEMVTSATWTASFLDSSVFMKVTDGQRRLYITTPEAYTQPAAEGLSWKKIQDLPSFTPNDDTEDGKGKEPPSDACWSYTGRLDEPISAPSSFDSRWSAKSPDNRNTERPVEAPSPNSSIVSFSAPLLHHRTHSLPSSTSATTLENKATIPKRRIASSEPHTSTLAAATHALESGGQEITTKRRRISLSPGAASGAAATAAAPEVEEGVEPNNPTVPIPTPRWSREPPSPFTTSEDVTAPRSQDGGGGSHGRFSRRRGTTPAAYATPYSNNNFNYSYFAGRMELGVGDGDTEADTEVGAERVVGGGGGGGGAVLEEEWEGVEDHCHVESHLVGEDDGCGGGGSSEQEGGFEGDLDEYSV